MSKSSIPISVQYEVTQTDNITGEVIYSVKSPNLVVKTGREYVLRNLFDLTGTDFVAMGAGASSNTATVDDTRLTYELIADTNRKTLTNTNGDPLSSSDIQTGTYTVEISPGVDATFYKLLTVQVIYDGATDPNVDSYFAEYGIFNTDTLPGTPTGTSGIMFNHYTPGSSIQLSAATTITVRANIYT